MELAPDSGICAQRGKGGVSGVLTQYQRAGARLRVRQRELGSACELQA